MVGLDDSGTQDARHDLSPSTAFGGPFLPAEDEGHGGVVFVVANPRVAICLNPSWKGL